MDWNGLSGRYGAILIDPPWRFANRTGKVAPEHRRLHRYETMTFEEIAALPLADIAKSQSHLYLWCPNALLLEALTIMKKWGFTYKTNIVWFKVRKDGGPDGRGVGFYFRNVTELLLFGTRGKLRTLAPGRSTNANAAPHSGYDAELKQSSTSLHARGSMSLMPQAGHWPLHSQDQRSYQLTPGFTKHSSWRYRMRSIPGCVSMANLPTCDFFRHVVERTK
jgi:N6-adenosine-specific RNA methylase IME4